MRAVIIVVMLGATAARAVPTTMTYAGVLTSGGAPVNDLVDVRFSLHDAPTLGTELYSEQQNGLIVAGGELLAEIGQNGLDDAVLGSAELFLEIAIDGDVLTPRVRLSSVPYALRAEAALLSDSALVADDASALGGIGASEYVTQTQLAGVAGTGLTFSAGVLSLATAGVSRVHLAVDAVQTANIANGAVTGAKIAADAITSGQIVDDTISALDLGPNAVGTVEIQSNAVNGTKIADGSVTAFDLADLTVINSKIGANAVDTSKIADNTITRADIAGVELDVFLQADGCGDGLTISTSCLTVPCGVNVSGQVTFRACGGSCSTSTSPVTCSNLPLVGRLLSNSQP